MGDGRFVKGFIPWNKGKKWAEMSAMKMGNKFGLGHKVTEEHKQKLRECFKGKPSKLTNEKKEKLRIAAINYQKKYGNPMQGRKHTLEARRKIIEANLSRTTCKGNLHYSFKGKDGNARGQSWSRKRKEFLVNKKLSSNSLELFCECCNRVLSENKLKANNANVHHLINARGVIDVVQDFNCEWNLMLLCHSCHSKIHNKLKGMAVNLSKQFILNYNQRASKAKEKMKELLNDAKKG
jgi:hypothetical protein